MAQYRNYTVEVNITDDDINIRSNIGGNLLAATIVRDGSMDTNFKAAMADHRDAALAAAPTATSQPCSVATIGKWNKVQQSASITSAATIITVPATNSGDLILSRDAGSFSMQYIVNGGTPTTFTDGAVITVADGDTLAFSVTSLVEQEFASGYVFDEDTDQQLDSISIYNTTPAP